MTQTTGISARRSRQAELVDSEILTTPITLIGAGGIGSFTALCLAKLGFHDITVYDSDGVSEENISSQFYRYHDIGSQETVALERMLHDFEGIYVTSNNRNWFPANRAKGIVISAVDNMTTRAQLYKHCKRNPKVLGFIDGRMGGQQAEVFAIEPKNPVHQKVYEQYLWTDEEASELPCTQKAVMYNVLWIASTISNTARLMLENKPYHHVQYMDFANQVQHIIKH